MKLECKLVELPFARDAAAALLTELANEGYELKSTLRNGNTGVFYRDGGLRPLAKIEAPAPVVAEAKPMVEEVKKVSLPAKVQPSWNKKR